MAFQMRMPAAPVLSCRPQAPRPGASCHLAHAVWLGLHTGEPGCSLHGCERQSPGRRGRTACQAYRDPNTLQLSDPGPSHSDPKKPSSPSHPNYLRTRRLHHGHQSRPDMTAAVMSPHRPTDPGYVPDMHHFSQEGSMHLASFSGSITDENSPLMDYIPPLDPEACTLRIFAINDVYILDHYPHLKSCIDTHSNGKNTIVTLAGDFLAPSLLSGLDQGHGAVDVMSAAGITHVCFGNHECDVPYDDLLRRMDESTFKWLSTNMRDLPLDGRAPLPEHDIITVSGPGQDRRIALLGLLTDDPGLYRQGAYAGAHIEPIEEAMDRAWTDMAELGVDAVVPMTHQDMMDDVSMASHWGPGGSKWENRKPEGPTPPLGIILGGHDHEIMYEVSGGCQIIKAGAEAENIAVIDLVWATPESKAPEIRVALVDALDFPADLSVGERVMGHYQRLEEVKRAPLCPVPEGVILSSKNARFQQTTVGTMLCSAMRDGFVSDGCIFNGGGIRANRDYPDSTEFFFLSDLESEMPFNNELVCVDMPGRVISDIVAYTRSFSFQNPPVEYGGFMQTDDGMRFCDETKRVTHVKNKPIDPDAKYAIVVTLIHLQGIDYIPPMVEFAKTVKVLPHDGVPCKMVIVNYFSRLMWLMMGSWTDLNAFNHDVISREAFMASARTKFDVDFVVDQVFNRCDFDGDGLVSKADMVASVLFTGFLFDHNADGVIHREQVRAFAQRVLGCEVEEDLVEQIMDTFDISGTGNISVEEMRIVTHPVEWRLQEVL